MDKPRYSRVLLKLSGEGFCREGGRGIEIDEVRSVARQVAQVAKLGIQVSVVVGGGNIVRGSELAKHGVNAATGDYMGMCATVVNALALQDILEHEGTPTRVLTAIPMSSVAEPFIRRRALRHQEKGRVIILAAGTGNPHFTTDTAAALRATELGAEVILKATKVDGVYTADPKKDPTAKRLETISYMQVLNMGLRVMDSTAISMCMENKIPIIVFDLKKEGNLVRAVRGEAVGTVIGAK